MVINCHNHTLKSANSNCMVIEVIKTRCCCTLQKFAKTTKFHSGNKSCFFHKYFSSELTLTKNKLIKSFTSKCILPNIRIIKQRTKDRNIPILHTIPSSILLNSDNKSLATYTKTVLR